MSSQSGRVDTLDGLNPNGYISSADIPEETDELVVVQALSEQLDEPIGTIVVKSVFDTYFPPKLKGIIDSDSFKTTVEVINWFLELRLYAETEKHSKTFDLSQTWRRLHSKYTVDRKRQAIIKQYCVDNRLVCPFFRDYTFTQEEFDEVERKLLEALHLFIDDENRNYIPRGWYWTYPENHGWLWMEFRKVQESPVTPSNRSIKRGSAKVSNGATSGVEYRGLEPGSALNGENSYTNPNSIGSSSMTSSSSSSAQVDSMMMYQSLLKNRLGQTLPNMPVPPTPEWGLHMKMTVLHHLKIEKHTEYLLLVETDMGRWTPVTVTYALKRYTDFEAFHDQLSAYIRHHEFDTVLPPLPDKSIVNTKAVTSKRIEAFQALLTHIASSPDLVSSPPVFKFFDVHPCPVAWRGLPYIKKCFIEIYN